MASTALSTEALLDLDPDVIVILTPREDARNLVSAFVELDTLSAVRERRIAVLAGARYLRTGPSVADLAADGEHRVERAHRLLKNHGDLFAAQGAWGWQ